MELDPPVQQFLEVNAGELQFLNRLSTCEQRRYMRLLTDLNFLRFSSPGPAVHSVTDHRVAVPGGEIRCRAYRPSGDTGLPAHLTLHGGAWWQGSIDDLICDAISRQRCAEARLVVVAVDYRLAPEHPYPTGLDDAYDAYHWLVEHAEDLGVDRSSISIGGNSAGANLAAALARKVRDAGGPQPILQLLEVPALDLTLATAREAAAAGGQDMAGELDVAVARYLSDPGAAREPLASPMLADDLNGLPPAVIFTAEHDPLRTEGERYAARLNAAGVPARATRHLGAMHATAMMTRTWAPAVAWQRGAAAALRSAHWDDAPVTGMAEADATTART